MLSILLLGWLALPPAARALGEEGRPLLRAWDEGAAGTQTWQVRQLPNGLIAFAWRQGLLFFDGERFDAVEVPGGTVYDFAPGPAQRIYVATGQQLGFLEPDASRQWRFVSLPLPAHAPPPGDIGRVLHHQGRTFYLSRSLLLIHEDSGWRWRSAKGLYAELRLREDGLLLYEDGSGWLRFDADSGEFLPYAQPGLPTSGLGSSSEQPGEPWYASDRKALYRRIDGAWERFAVDADPRWLDDRIETLARLPSGELAVGTRFGGLYQFSAGGHLVRRVAPSLLPGERITDLEIDAEGALWLALDGGVARLEADDRVTRFGRVDGASQIERIARIGGVLHIATRLGLKRLEPATADGLPAHFVDTRVRRNSAWDLLDTRHGLLVGTGSGLVLLPPDARAAPVEVLAGRRVSALAAAPDGWIYAVNANQLRRLRWQGSHFEVDAQALTLVPMFDLLWNEGLLWASIDGGGAFRIDALGRWPQPHVSRFDERHGLQASRTTFAVDSTGLLLLNAGRPWRPQGDGLVRASGFPENFQFERLMADGRSQWWATGEGGPVRRLEREAQGYEVRETLLQRFRYPSRHLHVDADSTLWLGDDEGLLRMRATPTEAPLRVEPLLREVRGADGALLYGGAGTGSHPARLELSAAQRELSMRFALPTFQHERPTRWRWRLDAGDWSPLEDATLRIGLPAGTSLLEVAASDGLGRASATLALHAQVAPHWFETLAARLAALGLLATVLAAGALGYARWRTQRLERERARLENLVAERSADVRRQAEEIRALSEARTRFFGNVSHEFRTPLTLVLGPLGDALDGRFGVLTSGLSAALETARSSARRLLRLVGELLDLSRLAAGRFELRIAEHDLAEQLRRELEAFAGQAHARGIELRGEGLADPLLFWYDADQLERMLANLLGNALKFTPTGGQVNLRLVPSAQEVAIQVEDDGPGISTEDQARVFERFYQGAAAAAPDAPGTGVGLALVRELIELHHGRAELASTPGHGSCFTLWLRRGNAHFSEAQLAQPQLLADSEVGITAAPPEEPPPGPAPVQRPTLLVVDDHAELRRYLADRLADAYQVSVARNGEEALAAIAEELPDVVVSDVMMPGVDGIDLARSLRRNPETAGVPLLLLSARAHKRDVVAGLEAGADDYLTKPFDTSELIARIETLLGTRRRLRAQLRDEQAAAAPAADETGTTDFGDSRQPTPIESAAQRFAERLQQVLAQRSDDPAFGVAELAEALHMDRATLFRRIRGSHKTTPSEWLREFRLQRAQSLLREHRGSVSEIAYAVGFENLSHFSQAFRKRFGVAPSSLLQPAGP